MPKEPETRILIPKGGNSGDHHSVNVVNSSFGNDGKRHTEYYDAAGSRLIYGSRNTDGPYSIDHVESHVPILRRTLTDINLLDADTLENIGSGKLGRFIMNDFITNFTVVSIPAIFTNAVWRAMNLGGIAVHESPRMVIVWTTVYIATAVFGVCALVDMIRQLILYKGDFKKYIEENGLRASLNLGWKFFMGVVGWTVGYEVVAGTHMFYAGDASAASMTYHAIGAAVGEFFGLLVACEVTHITEFIFTFHHSTNPPTGSLGVATKGTLEGAIWSVIGDANLYAKWGSTVGAGIADSLILGVCAALGFSVMGILTSIFGYYFIHRRLRAMHH